MKFFNAAFAAVAVGSAMATPMPIHDGECGPVELPTKYLTKVFTKTISPPKYTIQTVPLEKPSSTKLPDAHVTHAPHQPPKPPGVAPITVTTTVTGLPAPAPPVGGGPGYGQDGVSHTVPLDAPTGTGAIETLPAHPTAVPALPEHPSPIKVIVTKVTGILITLEGLIKKDIEGILAIVDGSEEIDCDLLIKLLLSLEDHLQALLGECVDPISGLILPTVGHIMEEDLKAVFELVKEIDTLLAEVKACLKHLLETVPAAVIKAIGHELEVVLDLIVPIVKPVTTLVNGILDCLTSEEHEIPIVSDLLRVVLEVKECAVELVTDITTALGLEPIVKPITEKLLG